MPRVLVVDDDSAIRQMVAEVLRDEGHITDEATNGSQALDVVKANRPDAILLDLMMPVMDGPTFLRACRDMPDCRRIPVILMSALNGARQVAAELGASGCLSKPFELPDMLSQLERALPN